MGHKIMVVGPVSSVNDVEEKVSLLTILARDSTQQNASIVSVM